MAKKQEIRGLGNHKLFFACLVLLLVLVSTKITVVSDFKNDLGVLGEETESSPTPFRQMVTGSSGSHEQPSTTRGSKIDTRELGVKLRELQAAHPGFDFHFELVNGKVVLIAKDSLGHVLTNKELEKRQTEKALKDDGVHVSTEDGELSIEKDHVSARSHFPLSVDPTTHTLTVTTPAGIKNVTVLPDVAVANFLSHDRVRIATDTSSFATRTRVASISAVTLTLQNNDLMYKIDAEKKKKLLGLIPVTSSTSTLVSAQNGQIIREAESLLSRVVGLLSF